MIIDTYGRINLLNMKGINIPMRLDDYGFGLYINSNTSFKQFLLKRSSKGYVGSCFGVSVVLTISQENDILSIDINLKNNGDEKIKRVFLRLGVDCYMDSYPQWNNKFFPTFFKCENDHFIGLMMSPNGDMLAIASPAYLPAWSLDYNIANYGEIHTGHRIYTACIDIFNVDVFSEDSSFCEIDRLIKMTTVKNENQARKFYKKVTGCPTIEIEKLTIEQGERIFVTSDGNVTIRFEDGSLINNGSQLNKIGYYNIVSELDKKESTALVYVRPSVYDYLEFGGNWAYKVKQKPSACCESYYGYFSMLAMLKHLQNHKDKNKIQSEFDDFLKLILNDKSECLVDAGYPHRIQNYAVIVSLCVDAYEAFKEDRYIELANTMSERLMENQWDDGSFRHPIMKKHYTCVIYPIKSILELYELEIKLGLFERAKKHYDSAYKAAKDLLINEDNIDTEGEMSFEDGMITCEILQLGKFALTLNKNDRIPYISLCKKLLSKHKCLEQQFSSDSRTKGCTLRFWEGMYDVLIRKNFLSSPHGWSSWKTYATYYLYLLTGDKVYLIDTFNTLSACLQCVDYKNQQLNWAFVVDPFIKAELFEQREGTQYGELRNKIFGSCYLPMISNWWKSRQNEVVFGYANPAMSRVDGEYFGASCDNDVHEHFKCLEEIGLCAYLHQDEESFISYNCALKNNVVKMNDERLQKILIFLQKPCVINVFGIDEVLHEGFNEINKK